MKEEVERGKYRARYWTRFGCGKKQTLLWRKVHESTSPHTQNEPDFLLDYRMDSQSKWETTGTILLIISSRAGCEKGARARRGT